MITQFTQGQLAQLRREMDQALTEVMDRHGLRYQIGRITFDQKEFRCKLTVNVNNFTFNGGGLTQVPVPNSDWTDEDSEYIGRKFVVRGRTFVITEVNRRRWKRPIVAKEDIIGGREFVFQETILSNLLP